MQAGQVSDSEMDQSPQKGFDRRVSFNPKPEVLLLEHPD